MVGPASLDILVLGETRKDAFSQPVHLREGEKGAQHTHTHTHTHTRRHAGTRAHSICRIESHQPASDCDSDALLSQPAPKRQKDDIVSTPTREHRVGSPGSEVEIVSERNLRTVAIRSDEVDASGSAPRTPLAATSQIPHSPTNAERAVSPPIDAPSQLPADDSNDDDDVGVFGDQGLVVYGGTCLYCGAMSNDDDPIHADMNIQWAFYKPSVAPATTTEQMTPVGNSCYYCHSVCHRMYRAFTRREALNMVTTQADFASQFIGNRNVVVSMMRSRR